MKRVAIFLAAGALLASTLPASASHGDGPKFQAWIKSADFRYDYETCHYAVWAYGQEFGQHGVEQIKFRFRRYLGAIPEWSPSADFTRSISADTGWLYSNPFPNDGRNQWARAGWVRSVTLAQNNYTIRAKVVGIRPSWWQPDLTATVHFGYCDASAEPVHLGS